MNLIKYLHIHKVQMLVLVPSSKQGENPIRKCLKTTPIYNKVSTNKT